MAKEKPATKTCKHCATEIPYDAKVCPNCRKKVKGGKLKWIIIALVVLVIIVMAAGGGSDDKKEDTAPAKTQEAADQTDSKEQEDAQEEEEEVEEKIEYKKYKCTELFDDLKTNALKAEKKHQDEYVEISGYLTNIDSDGSYISLGAGEDDYDYMFEDLECYVQSDEQLDVIMDLSKGDKIVVKGQISSIGEILGYDMKIAEIKKAK